MSIKGAAFAVVMLLGLTSMASAGSVTITHTSPQSTSIQNRLIPRYNTAHCARFSLGASCTSANLVTAGCVAVVVKTLTVESCTIFTSNAAGEAAFAQETGDQKFADIFFQTESQERVIFDAALEAANQTQKDNICAILSLPSGCRQ